MKTLWGTGFLLFLLTFSASAPMTASGHDLQFDHLSAEDGLADQDIASIIHDSQSMCFGTANGLSRCNPRTETFRNYDVFNQPVPIGGDSSLQKHSSYTEKNFLFTYTKLPVGRDTFRVKASNNEGLWNDEGTSVTIIVLPPCCETWWFRGGMLLLILGLVVGGYHWRRRMLELRKRVLEYQVAERTRALAETNQQLHQEIAEHENIEEDLQHHQEYLEECVQEELEKLHQQEQLLIQKSKLESLGSLSAGIAHEINQPLTRIALGIDNLLLKVVENQRINHEFLENKCHRILESIQQIKQIIEHIRTFSRDQQSLHAERVDVNATVHNALTFVQAQYQHHNITITSDLRATDWVLGNPYRLEQVLLNILSNARDAIETKFSGIESAFQSGGIHIWTYSDEKQTAIEITDTGPGIPADALEHIFDPFFTTKPVGKGTGLGLSVSYGIIKDMHGDITGKSRPGEGTVMSISLPRIH